MKLRRCLALAMLSAAVAQGPRLSLLAQSPATPSGTRSGAVAAGELVIDPPALINLGFEWFMQGDENRNASVAVSYRKQGETTWHAALPLLRLNGERNPARRAAAPSRIHRAAAL